MVDCAVVGEPKLRKPFPDVGYELPLVAEIVRVGLEVPDREPASGKLQDVVQGHDGKAIHGNRQGLAADDVGVVYQHVHLNPVRPERPELDEGVGIAAGEDPYLPNGPAVSGAGELPRTLYPACELSAGVVLSGELNQNFAGPAHGADFDPATPVKVVQGAGHRQYPGGAFDKPGVPGPGS